eukprot:315590_1
MLRSSLRHTPHGKSIYHRYPPVQALHCLQYTFSTEKLQQIPLTNLTLDEQTKDNISEDEFNFKKTLLQYKTLSKWNLSLLNGVVTGSTAFICSGGALLACTLPATIGCVSLAMSAAALNQLQECKYDSLMLRTKLIRPLCNGKLTPTNAKVWSTLSMMIGISTLSVYCGNTAAIIGISTLFMYNAVYTPLKRLTPYNTEFGAIVGALPPQIGIAASHYQSNMDPSFINVLS